MGVSQTLRRWTEGATYIRQVGHHVGHWPTFWFFKSSETTYCSNDYSSCRVSRNEMLDLVAIRIRLTWSCSLFSKFTWSVRTRCYKSDNLLLCLSILTRILLSVNMAKLVKFFHVLLIILAAARWLKYKFGGPGTLKNLGPYCQLKGPSQPARTVNGCVGPGNARQLFLGAQERRSPAFPLTLTTAAAESRRLLQLLPILHWVRTNYPIYLSISHYQYVEWYMTLCLQIAWWLAHWHVWRGTQNVNFSCTSWGVAVV